MIEVVGAYTDFQTSCLQRRQHLEALDPVLGEVMLDLQGRITTVYLIGHRNRSGIKIKPDEYGALWQHLGEETSVFRSTTERMVSTLAALLLHGCSWQRRVVNVAIDPLMTTLMNHSGKAMRVQLVCTDAWQSLLQSLGSSDGSILMSIDGSLVRTLITSICRGCSEGTLISENPKVSQNSRLHFATVIDLIKRRLTSVLSQLQNPSVMAQSSVADELVALLSNSLQTARGVAAVSDRHSYDLGCGFLLEVMPVLVHLVRQTPLPPSVVLLILQTFTDTASGNIAYMDEETLMQFCCASTNLVEAWSVMHRKRASAGIRLDPSLEGQVAEEIESLLLLLGGILCKQAVDKSRDHFRNPSYPTEFVLSTLNMLLPNFSTDLLLYPVVIKNYFEILEVIITVQPEKFATMEPSARATMVESAKFAAKSKSEEEVVILGLNIIKLIGQFHFESLNLPGRPASPFAADLVPMQQLLFKLLLFEPWFSPSLLRPLSDALLPLMILQPQSYQHMASDVLNQGAGDVRDQLKQGFQDLIQNGLQGDLSARNFECFYSNVLHFVQKVRVILQSK